MIESTKHALKRLVIRRLRREDAARRRALPGGFGGLPPSLWGYEASTAGDLTVQGIRLTELVTEFGSPLYVVSLPWLERTHDDFLAPFRAIHANTQLGTSYKTNPLPCVLRALHDIGTYAEVISDFELWLATRLGVPGGRIVVNGPGKSRPMIARAVEVGAKVINIDSLGEIDLIAGEAQRHVRRQPVGVRTVTSVGWSSQFGLSIASGDALAAFERIAKSPWLTPVGIHLHIGTGLKNVEFYSRAIREVLEFGRELRRQLGIELGIYDLGGGFGVPTVRGADPWDDRMVAMGYPAREAIPDDCPTPQHYAATMRQLFDEFLGGDPKVEIILEPGRAITSSAQSLVLQVIAAKGTGAKPKFILDGGKNITLPLGWETHKIFPTAGLLNPFDIECDLYGPLCHPGDIVARHLSLPAMQIGDSIAIMDAGAYFVPNQMNFSNPRPAVVTIRDGQARLARRRESFEDIVRLDEIE